MCSIRRKSCPGIALLVSFITIASLFLFGCGSDDDPFTPDPNSDFRILAVTPVDQADSVSVFSTIIVTFNRPLDPTSINSTTVQLGSVPGTVQADASLLIFTPLTSLTPGRQYTLAINSAVADMTGETLARNFTSVFTVIASPNPVVSRAGADQEATRGAQVTLDAGGSLDPNNLPLTYQWTQLGGPSVQFNTTAAAPAFMAPDSLGALPFQLVASSAAGRGHPDTMTVFVGSGRTSALFVSHLGNDNASGNRLSPFATIQHALNVAAATGTSDDIHITGGLHNETLILTDGVDIYGGFDPHTWVRDLNQSPTRIMGGQTAIQGRNLNQVTLDGFLIVAGNTNNVLRTVAVIRLINSSDITLKNLKLIAGDGDHGPVQPVSAAPNRTANGAAGQKGSDNIFVTPQGGAGGKGDDLNDGGDGAVSSLLGGFRGYDGDGANGGLGGEGGFVHWAGFAGHTGGAGTIGTDATGGGSAFGALNNEGIYLMSGGSRGNEGGIGCGGGGGGSGGGAMAMVFGGAGGGGGAGGRGGIGGLGGIGGGGSFGIVLSNVTELEISNCHIATGTGGAGGPGGQGGPGENGGYGGNGGEEFTYSGTGAGGKGGGGGTGGIGGSGSGGGGGPSVGILERSSTLTLLEVTYSIGGGGLGGTNPSGATGDTGVSAERKEVQ